jgi:hypothetical protein
MDEQEPEAKLSSPIVGPEKLYTGKPERVDRALFVAAAIAIVVLVLGWLLVAGWVVPRLG